MGYPNHKYFRISYVWDIYIFKSQVFVSGIFYGQGYPIPVRPGPLPP